MAPLDMIVIVDYGMGNLGSITNMFRKIGADAVVSAAEAVILGSKKVVLPGIGAFDMGIKNLRERALISPLTTCVLEKKVPVLGICLGTQLMTRSSEEGSETGLGWLDARTVRF